MIHVKSIGYGLTCFGIFFLQAACTHQTAPSIEPIEALDEAKVESSPTERPAKPPARHQRQSSAAVQYLVAEAKTALQNGDFNLAQSHLERAFRIDNRDPWVSYYMSTVLLAQSDPIRAEQWAFQALSYFPETERQSKRQCWELIASCRRQRGDLRGANEAQRQADEHYEASTGR